MTTRTTCIISFFFFNDTATTEIYTLSLHDALPILRKLSKSGRPTDRLDMRILTALSERGRDRKSTRLNSSHSQISYAVFCLKKKKKNNERDEIRRMVNFPLRLDRDRRAAHCPSLCV